MHKDLKAAYDKLTEALDILQGSDFEFSTRDAESCIEAAMNELEEFENDGDKE